MIVIGFFFWLLIAIGVDRPANVYIRYVAHVMTDVSRGVNYRLGHD